MIPFLLLRCPACRHVALRRRFAPVADGGRLVECPACGHRFQPIDEPRLE